MKIIIDAYQYSQAVTGTDRMAHNFLQELQQLDTDNSYLVLCSREKYTRTAIKNRNFQVVKPPFPCSLPFFGRYFSYIWRRLSKVMLLLWKADVYYSFHNMALPGRRLAPRMITSNLDLIPILLPEYGNIGRASTDEVKASYRRTIELADKFVSISKYSKTELSDVLGVPKSKIEVVYLAADPSFETGLRDPLPESLGISGKYIFTIGGSEPRKNVATVIEAYQSLSAKTKQEYKLVIAGGKWHGRKLDIPKEERKNIVELGFVPDEHLGALYSHASVFVFASTYEGFGFTILEAMASGTPVVNAHGSSLDEVAGDATLSFDPLDARQLADRLKSLLNDKKLQKELVEKGFQQNQKFSWEKAGKQLHAILTGE